MWVCQNIAYTQDGETQYSIAFETYEEATKWLDDPIFDDIMRPYCLGYEWVMLREVKYGEVF